MPRLWSWVREYLVAVLLVGAFAHAMIQVYVTGTPPVPQQPPEGYVLQRLEARLQWNKGSDDGEVTLQVSMDDPDFLEPLVDKQQRGTTYRMRDLEPGHIYYWRVLKGDEASAVASFETSPYAIEF